MGGLRMPCNLHVQPLLREEDPNLEPPNFSTPLDSWLPDYLFNPFTMSCPLGQQKKVAGIYCDIAQIVVSQGNPRKGHALVKGRGLLGLFYDWLTSLLWCFHMCCLRLLFWTRRATNFVRKFWQVPFWSLPWWVSGSATPKHRGKWRFLHSPHHLSQIYWIILVEWICPKKPTCGRCIVYLQRLLFWAASHLEVSLQTQTYYV